MTNSTLVAIEADLKKLVNESPAFYYFFREKVKQFYQRNSIVINGIGRNKERLAKEYAVYNEAGEPVLVDQEGEKHYTFINAEAEKAFKDGLAEFLTRSIFVEI